MADTLTIDKAMEKAVNDTPKTETTETQDTATGAAAENSESDTANNSDSAPELDEHGLSVDEQNKARGLFAALKDPHKASAIVDVLAQRAGYTKIETKQDVKEAKDEILEIFQTELGPELEFLTPRLSKAVEKILNTKLKESIAAEVQDIRRAHDQSEQERVRSEGDTALKAIGTQYFSDGKIPDNILTKMNSLMDETKPTANMTPERYLNKIFNEACGELGITKKPVKQTERIERSRNNAPSRLAGERTGTPVKSDGPTKMSIDQAIQAAIDAQEK